MQSSKAELLTAKSDEELIVLACHQDADAMSTLLERYKDFVRIKARPYFLIGADRDDVIQEGMIGLYKAIRSYEPDKHTSFRSFADLCVTRQIITAVKNSTRQKHAPLNMYVSLNKTVNEEDEKETSILDLLTAKEIVNPEEILIGQEDLAEMQRKMDKRLSGMEKKVLTYYLEGLDYQQIAITMGKNSKSIDNALQRIKHKVEGILRDHNS